MTTDVIPVDSNHPWKQKMANFQSMISRFLKEPMEKHILKRKRCNKIPSYKNGYNSMITDKIITKNAQKLKQ